MLEITCDTPTNVRFRLDARTVLFLPSFSSGAFGKPEIYPLSRGSEIAVGRVPLCKAGATSCRQRGAQQISRQFEPFDWETRSERLLIRQCDATMLLDSSHFTSFSPVSFETPYPTKTVYLILNVSLETLRGRTASRPCFAKCLSSGDHLMLNGDTLGLVGKESAVLELCGGG